MTTSTEPPRSGSDHAREAPPDLPRDRELRNTFEEQRRIDRIQRETAERRGRDQLVRSLLEGAFVVVATEWVLFGLAFWSLPLLALVGAAMGGVAHRLNAQRGVAMLVALGGLTAARLVAGQVFMYSAMIYYILGACLFVAVRLPRASERTGW